jgi:hypothetical protein
VSIDAEQGEMGRLVGATRALVIAGALAMGVACSSSSSPPSQAQPAAVDEVDPPSTTTSSTSAPPPISEEEAILAAYQGYWDTWLAANDPPNPDHPDLERYFTGPSLTRAKEKIADRLALGMATRLPTNSQYRHDAVVVEILAGKAFLEDCAVDDAQIVMRTDGTVLNDAVSTTLGRVELHKIGVEWKVYDLQKLEQWDGVAGCALDG